MNAEASTSGQESKVLPSWYISLLDQKGDRGTMREAQAPPPTEGARGGNICSDARMCFSENVNCGTTEENVQGRTRGSESAAHKSNDTHIR